MRTFVWFVFFAWMSYLPASLAAADINLFTVKIVETDAEAAQGKRAAFNELLEKAVKIELVRLTGSAEVLSQSETQAILNQPKKWLKNYRYEPYEQDGVRVGTQLVFEFDRERVYRYFQQQGLVVWPLANRPQTLVMGSQLLAGSLMKLDQTNLSYLPNIDYRPIAQQLAMPVQVGSSESVWVYPDAEETHPVAADVMQETEARYLLSFQAVMDVQGGESLKWQLFAKDGSVLLSQPLTDGDTKAQLEQAFAQLMSFYSAGYREQAGFLGSLTLSVNGIDQVDKLNALETWLNQQKPILHQARLNHVTPTQAVFELIYQGDYAQVLNRLAGWPQLKLVEESAIVGQIKAVWVDTSAYQNLD